VPKRPLSPPDLAGRLASYETLVDISHMLLVSVTLDDLFDRISTELNRLVPVDALTIYRVDDVNREIVPVHARDQWADEIMAAPLRLGEGLTGWVVERREAANVTAAERDPRIAVVPGTPADEPEAIVCVPLVVRDRPIGALNTYRLGVGAAFSADEFELVRQFADLAALALDNTQNRIRLLHEAQTDWLTGLHNHRVYHERLRDELERAERYGRPVSLIVFDLDDFKLLNDVHGHQEGDLVLRRVAAAAREELRTSDLACRVGGEEFAIILPEAGKRAARAAADRLCARVRAQPGVRTVTVSCGVASFPADARSATELVAGADAALYAAKARGKDRAASFTSAVLARRARQAARAGGVESISQLRLLTALAAKLNRLNDVDRIADAVVDDLAGLVDYDHAAVRLLDADGAGLEPVALRGPAPLAATRAAATAAASGRTVNTGDEVGDGGEDESVLAVPLAYDRRTIGVLELSRRGANRFSDLSVRLAELLAAHAATALSNARLLAAQRRATAVAEALLGIATAASRETSPRAVGLRIVQVVCELTGAAAASIVVETGAGRRQRVLAAHGQASARSVGLAAALTCDRRSAGVTVVRSADLPAVSAEAVRRHGHVATAPIHGGRLTVVCDHFPQTALETIAAVAGQGGLALEHAELLARLRDAGELSDRRRRGA
jgi:diguanylate cyclase (GGDEF)-like protein